MQNIALVISGNGQYLATFAQQIERHQYKDKHRKHRKTADDKQLGHVPGDVARGEEMHLLWLRLRRWHA